MRRGTCRTDLRLFFSRHQTPLPGGFTKSYLIHLSSINRDVLDDGRLGIPLPKSFKIKPNRFDFEWLDEKPACLRTQAGSTTNPQALCLLG